MSLTLLIGHLRINWGRVERQNPHSLFFITLLSRKIIVITRGCSMMSLIRSPGVAQGAALRRPYLNGFLY